MKTGEYVIHVTPLIGFETEQYVTVHLSEVRRGQLSYAALLIWSKSSHPLGLLTIHHLICIVNSLACVQCVQYVLDATI